MHGEHRAMVRPALLDPDHRVGSEPVMSMHDIKMAYVIFSLEKVPDKRTAHLLDFADKTAVLIVWTVVIPHAVDGPHAARPIAWAREHVHFVATALQRRRQFSHVRRYPAHSMGVQRFPREHCDAHTVSSINGLLAAPARIKVWFTITHSSIPPPVCINPPRPMLICQASKALPF